MNKACIELKYKEVYYNILSFNFVIGNCDNNKYKILVNIQ